MTRVAVGDIGTNTARLLVADVVGDRVRELDVRTHVVGLGRGLHASGLFQPDAMDRAIEALGSFSDAFASAEQSIIVATSASRDAQNREVFFDSVEQACSVRPTLISGEEEANYAFVGASRTIPDERVTVIDIGGGSTEFVTGRESVESAISVDIGSVRLTDLHLGLGPIPPERLEAARRLAGSSFKGIAPTGRPIGVAGTCTTVAGTLLGLTVHDRERVHLSSIALVDVRALLERLSALSVDEIAQVGTIGEKRAPVILGGLVVLEAAMEAVGAWQMVVSERDLLHGAAIGLVS